MANIIKIKNKTSAGVPIASQMEAKELVMHEVDNSLYYKRASDNVVVKVNEASGGGTTNNFIQSTAPTVAPGTPYTWWDTSNGNITLWIENGL